MTTVVLCLESTPYGAGAVLVLHDFDNCVKVSDWPVVRHVLDARLFYQHRAASDPVFLFIL